MTERGDTISGLRDSYQASLNESGSFLNQKDRQASMEALNALMPSPQAIVAMQTSTFRNVTRGLLGEFGKITGFTSHIVDVAHLDHISAPKDLPAKAKAEPERASFAVAHVDAHDMHPLPTPGTGPSGKGGRTAV